MTCVSCGAVYGPDVRAVPHAPDCTGDGCELVGACVVTAMTVGVDHLARQLVDVAEVVTEHIAGETSATEAILRVAAVLAEGRDDDETAGVPTKVERDR